MATYALLHGGGDSGWYWHLVEAELRARGHRTVAPDLPADDESATLETYADAVLAALGDDTTDVTVVAQSFGGFTAPLVADRLPGSRLVFVAGMVPQPGEPPERWWANTGHEAAVAEQAAADGGLTGHDDPRVVYLHDVPADLADEALTRERAHPSTAAYTQAWPLPALPDVPTRFVLCTGDRLFPAAWLRQVVRDRLGVEPEELAAGHCAALARPHELASLLDGGGAGDQGGGVHTGRQDAGDRAGAGLEAGRAEGVRDGRGSVPDQQ